jgi:integrase
MKQTVNKLEKGSLRQVPRANQKFAWEWRYVDPATGGYRSKTFSGNKFPEQADIEKHIKPFIARLNPGEIEDLIVDPTMDDLLNHFIAEEHLIEIKNRRPGERASRTDELSFSTAVSYLSLCNRIREEWCAIKLDNFRPLKFQNWLKELELAPKTKGHLKAFMHRLFGKAKLYGMVEWVENPIGLVEVRGISKRRRKPADLTIEQFWQIFNLLPEPYSVMTLVEQCTGLRVDELLALRWATVDFERLCMEIKEGVVHDRIGPVKTECSADEIPLDPDFASILLKLKLKSTGSEWIFPSPKTGRCYHASPIQQDWIRRAGWCLVACPECGVHPGRVCTMTTPGRGKQSKIPVHVARRSLATERGLGSIGWHTYRHTYRSLLSGEETPLDVQQKLMRHAHLSTTDDYGGPPMENRRQANSVVVRKILKRQAFQQ